jgi:hypothetical protein
VALRPRVLVVTARGLVIANILVPCIQPLLNIRIFASSDRNDTSRRQVPRRLEDLDLVALCVCVCVFSPGVFRSEQVVADGQARDKTSRSFFACMIVRPGDHLTQKRKDAGSTGKRVTAETGCIGDGVRKCTADADGGLYQGAGRGMAEKGVRGEASNHH